MIDLTGVSYNPSVEEIVDILCNVTQNTDRGFFRSEVLFFLGTVASNMRATIVTKDRGEIPVNMYTLALGASGFGKGYSVGVMENDILSGYRDKFINETLPTIAESNIYNIAAARAIKYGTTEDEEQLKAINEYNATGTFPFTFDSGTVPAVKQLRHKLLMAECGAVNLRIDEIGSNLFDTSDLLDTFLELYDQGIVKQKLTKNTAENQRVEEIHGKTPANLLMFGTPSKLLDGGKTEDLFYDFLETGYARRCMFAWGIAENKAHNKMSAQEVFDRLTSSTNNYNIRKWKQHFTSLAECSNYNWKVFVPDDVAIKLIEYKLNCERAAEQLPEHEELRKTELMHRYFKALKVMGALAYMEQATDATMDLLMQAILYVEDSGKDFKRILTRVKNHVRLAKYLADIKTEVTHADLQEALPFYKGSASVRNEMLTLARAWGYKEHIVIKNRYVDNVELFSAETLERTNLDEIIISYSDHFAYDYEPEVAPFNMMDQLCLSDGMHWCNHQFSNKHRREENAHVGFNMVVLDIDGGISVQAVKELLSDYVYAIYTTKRHTEEENRFRLMLPINYVLELDSDEYVAFMDSLSLWLPFSIDVSANQRSRKWMTNPDGEWFINEEGELLDALNFIPRTTKNENYKAEYIKVQSLDNLERWFAQRMATGNRNNQILKYAMALVDNGMDLHSIQQHVHSFNKKLPNSLSADELDNTVLRSVAKKFI